MRRATSNGNQALKASDMKRLKELEQENSLLRILYADLLQKFSSMKDGLVRHARLCEPAMRRCHGGERSLDCLQLSGE